MNDYKIIIDAGHGGTDPGASSIPNNIVEKDYTLMMSKYMFDKFKQLGLDVKLVRDSDETLSPNERIKRILDAYPKNPKTIVISNHLNAGGGRGAEVIYALRNTDELSKLILENLGKTGIPTRRVYQRTLSSDSSKDYYYIQRDTNPLEAVIVEYGFLDTKSDADFIKANYKKMVDSVVASVIEYIDFETDNNTTPPSNNIYVVKKGDSLSKIALKYDTTTEKLKKLNNLTSDLIFVDQELIIPNISTVNYMVKPGDTLYSIAKEFNSSIDNIKKANNLTSDILSVNQNLIIHSDDTEDSEILYIIKSGDTLYSIAKKFGTTVADIERINGLTSNTLSIGSTLQIPSYNTKQTYEVALDDTLYSIAKKFNTTVDSIKVNNNLKNNILTIGQILTIF